MRRVSTYSGLIGLVLALSGSVALEGVALAQDDDDDSGRRVLKARDVDEQAAISEEYARLAQQKRLESIQFLKELLSRGEAEGDRKAEMMLRLSDLYFEQGRALYLQEMEAYDVEFDRCFNTEGCDTESLRADNSGSADWQQKSIRLYQQILRSYPRYARADEAIYYLASAQSDTGDRDSAVENYTKLVKLYPDSKYVPDSHVQIGEYYFDKNNAYKALLAYKKATAYRDSEKYSFALYKLGWCYYNVGEYDKGIATMKSVVSYSMSQESEGAGNRLQLQEEALKDLVRFFADAGELDQAYEYFSKLGKNDLIRKMLKRLATMYFEQGKFEQAVQTYRRLIAEDPQNPRNVDYQNEIVQAYLKMGDREQQFSEIDRMLKTYGKDSAWARANASNPDAIAEAEESIEKNIRSMAYFHHERARKLSGSESKASYDLAYRAYNMYLDNFPESQHAYEVRYSYAELLYKLKKYDAAFDQYMAVVKMDPQGKHSKFCAESAIFSADEMVKKEGGNQSITAKAGEARDPIPLTDWEQRMVDACNQFATLYPEEKKVRNIIYKSAYLLYNKYQFDKAAEQFNLVIAMDPGAREAEQAANLILDSFVINENWQSLRDNAKVYYEQEGLGSRKFKGEVYDIYMNASAKLIEVDFAANSDHGKTADAYKTFLVEFPTYPEKARVLNNMAIYYSTADRRGDAMEVRKTLVDGADYGDKTKYYYDQMSALGYDYETIAAFDEAAGYYERLFGEWEDERKKRVKEEADEAALAKLDTSAADAIYSAAVFRNALGQWEASIGDYQKFMAAFPADERLNDTQLTIGRIYEDHEQWADAAGVFYNFYKTPDDKPVEMVYFARLHHADALFAQNKDRDGLKLYTETVAMYKKYIEGGGQVGAHTEFVAQMMFKLAEPTMESYLASEIKPASTRSRKLEDKGLGDALKAKAKGLAEVEQTYKEIIDTGAGEWGLAALVKLGQAYENMGESLKNSHVPSYLTPDQVELYTMAIEDKVYPQVEKSVAAYQASLGKSYELTLYNENTAFATRRLGELRPNDFPGLREELVEVRLTSSAGGRDYSFETSL
ncbi:MAG: tetratricopeptide repeat protein [Proteobacteria bacterium]|nr:tetratricopeptide repeat protein [Pseudomonadota bacterium]